MISYSPRRPMRWNAAIGAIARCKATSIASARKRKSVRVLRWICGVKPKLKAVNKPSPHSIRPGLDKPGDFTTVSIFRSGFALHVRLASNALARATRELTAVTHRNAEAPDPTPVGKPPRTAPDA